MKARHILSILVVAGLTAFALLSCALPPVSIEQRVSTFQSDLNTADRSMIYQDFHPSSTTQYDPLKDPNTSGFNTAFPPPSGTNYSLTIVDMSNPAAGVIVQVSAGPNSGSAHATPYYLKLTMATTNDNDWRIVTLSDSAINGSYVLRFS
jgi:hypothetical protein